MAASNRRLHSSPRGLVDELREAILNCGQTEYRVAKESGVSQPVLNRFLRGERGISLETAAKFCRTSDCTWLPCAAEPKRQGSNGPGSKTSLGRNAVFGAIELRGTPHVLRFCCSPVFSPCSAPAPKSHAGPLFARPATGRVSDLRAALAAPRDMIAALAALAADPQGRSAGRFPP